MEEEKNRRGYVFILLGLSFLGLYLTSLYNYILFHSFAEIFSIVIACSVFIIVWNSRQFVENNYFLLIGIAYLFVSGLDLIHTLAYKGMEVFKGYDANLPTQLWIIPRFLESLSLLIAPIFLKRKLKLYLIFLGYAGITTLSLLSIFYWNVFPDCYIEGVGLTLFKKISEYVISLILLASIFLLLKHRDEFHKDVLKMVIWSIILTIGSELAFTLYVSVYGFSNLVGHYLKILSFYLIYKAIIETGLRRPYDLLFKNLKKSEGNLKKRNTHLEELNERFKNEIYHRKLMEEEREKLIRELQEALAKVKKLSGLLPICASCKKIRDDKGYWNQIESYVREHSEAEFSHGICPECMKKLYPGEI